MLIHASPKVMEAQMDQLWVWDVFAIISCQRVAGISKSADS